MNIATTLRNAKRVRIKPTDSGRSQTIEEMAMIIVKRSENITPMVDRMNGQVIQILGYRDDSWVVSVRRCFPFVGDIGTSLKQIPIFCGVGVSHQNPPRIIYRNYGNDDCNKRIIPKPDDELYPLLLEFADFYEKFRKRA